MPRAAVTITLAALAVVLGALPAAGSESSWEHYRPPVRIFPKPVNSCVNVFPKSFKIFVFEGISRLGVRGPTRMARVPGAAEAYAKFRLRHVLRRGAAGLNAGAAAGAAVAWVKRMFFEIIFRKHFYKICF